MIGVWEAMTATDVAPNSLTVVERYEHRPMSGGTAAKVGLQVNLRITALMCIADMLVLSPADYFRIQDIYKPGRMSVIDFDGVPEAISHGLVYGIPVEPA